MGGRRRAVRRTETPLVCDVVAWSVQRRPPELVPGDWVLWGLEAVLATTSGDTSGPDLPSARPRVPVDPDEELHLSRPAEIRGTAPWLPAPDLGPQRVSASSRSAWLRPTRGAPTWGAPRRELPLEQLALTSASCRDHYRRRRRAGARWTLEVSGEDARATITGSWLALAWLGHLAGWPEP